MFVCSLLGSSISPVQAPRSDSLTQSYIYHSTRFRPGLLTSTKIEHRHDIETIKNQISISRYQSEYNYSTTAIMMSHDETSIFK